MNTITITTPDDLFDGDAGPIPWGADPDFQFATEVDALSTLQLLRDELESAREQVRHTMRYLEAAAKAAHGGTAEDGPVNPQAIINHSGVARQTVYNWIGPKTGA